MNEQTVSWLLEAETPAIRCLALRDLVGLPEDDVRVTAERRAIMAEGPVPAILAGQSGEGHWAAERSYYTPKYTATHWSLMLLEELLVDGADARFRRGVDFMLGDTADGLRERLATNELGLSCFYGNMLRYVCRAGLSGDDRTAVLLAYSLRDMANGRCRCASNGGYACAWGVVRTLWGMAALPPEARTPAVRRAIEQGLEFLLEPGTLPAADYPMPEDGRVHAMWSRLNFPLFYQADILFILRVVHELGALEWPGAQEALGWLESRRMKNGRWRGSSPYRQRTYAAMGGVEETNRWVTLHAMRLLNGD